MEEKEWFLYVVDHHEGPFTLKEIQKLVKSGDAKSSSYVWKEGYADWVMMSDVTEFGPGGSKSDGHGLSFFSFSFGKKKTAAPAKAAVAAPEAGFASGPDLGGVTASSSVWCLNSKKVFSGPHSMKTIVRKINDGEVLVSDTVWKEGWTSFMPISNIPDFMQTVNPEILQGGKKGKKAKGGGATAAAMGLSGGPSARSYKWYKSSKFMGVMVLFILVGLYQALSQGTLDPLLEKANLKEKVKAFELKPIPFEKTTDLLGGVKDVLMPLLQKASGVLPESMQAWLSPITLPEGISKNDVDTLRDVAMSDPKNGPKVMTALPAGDEFNPAFVVVSNMPDNTGFMVTLNGKEGTLLNAFAYEKTVFIDMTKHVGTTPRFSFEGGKPLPKGEYTIVVYEADKQPPEIAGLLASLPKKNTPNIIPKGKVVFGVDSYFLGGKKDATYTARLKEFNDRSKARLTQETNDLKQIALTLESIANESATKFFSLAATPATPQRKNTWLQYDAKYLKLSGQIKVMASKVTPETKQEYLLPHLYQKTLQTYELTERLHKVETDFIDKGGKMDDVKAQAAQTADAINELKQAIFKVIK